MVIVHEHLRIHPEPLPAPPRRPPGWGAASLARLAGRRLWLVWERRAVDVAVVHPPLLPELRARLELSGYRLFGITPTAQVWVRPRPFSARSETAAVFGPQPAGR